MSPHPAPAACYLLSEDGHAQLCRLAEHLYLLARLARAYAPDEVDDAPASIPPTQWAASLHVCGDILDGALAGLRWQGP